MVKLKKRSKRIFELLKNYPNGITGEQMAKQLGVSSRTIRSDIKFLQELLEPQVQMRSQVASKRFVITQRPADLRW